MITEGKPNKYRKREIPERFKPLARLFSNDHVAKFLSGSIPEDCNPELAQQTAKLIGYKAPIALRIANEIVDQQEGKTTAEAIEIELGKLTEIFSTEDALEGLSSLGRKRPEYKGR